jgi:hypothetical protein
MHDRIGATTVRRFIDARRVLRLVEGDFAPIFAAYDEHVRRWELATEPDTRRLIEPGLAALTLHLATRLADESVGATINLIAPPRNVFLTGHAGDGVVTGRVFVEDVQTAATGRFFVQSFRPPTGSTQSIVEITGDDVLTMFETYYARSEQFPARFLALGGTRFGLVQALPDGGRDALAAADRDAILALFAGPKDLLVEQTFHFRCGCSPDKVAGALREIFAGRPEELFRGDPGVEAFCPRCGARWWIERGVFDAAPPPGISD